MFFDKIFQWMCKSQRFSFSRRMTNCYYSMIMNRIDNILNEGSDIKPGPITVSNVVNPWNQFSLRRNQPMRPILFKKKSTDRNKDFVWSFLTVGFVSCLIWTERLWINRQKIIIFTIKKKKAFTSKCCMICPKNVAKRSDFLEADSFSLKIYHKILLPTPFSAMNTWNALKVFPVLLDF